MSVKEGKTDDGALGLYSALGTKFEPLIKETSQVLAETNRILSEASKKQRIQNGILIFLSLVIAGATIFYSIFTYKSVIAVKESNKIQKQILELNIETEMKKQFQLSNVPALFPSVVPKDVVKNLVLEEKIKQSTGAVRYSKEEFAEVLKYYVLLENVADKIAYDVQMYVYDSDTKSYLKSAQGKAYVRPKDKDAIAFFEEKNNYIDEKQLIIDINNLYDLNLVSLNDYIKSKESNSLLLFFKDIQGNIYLRTRVFGYDKQNNRLQGGTDLYQLN